MATVFFQLILVLEALQKVLSTSLALSRFIDEPYR
jgi:hypothetical protein